MGLPRSPRLLALVAAAVVALSTCAVGAESTARLTETRPVRIIVVDERGEPIRGAQITFDGREILTDVGGQALIRISEPVSALVSANGTLDEPVAIGADDLSTTIRMWDRVGADGVERTSMHFGGDVMLGRRYLETDRLDTPLVTDSASARLVVADLAPISQAADWTVVNLESVVGELPEDEAYAGKRFLLQSTPLVTEALDELGVDLVTLGNNHAYDWRDPGIESTIAILDEAEIAHVGAGLGAGDAVRGQLVAIRGGTVGIVSYTTLSGSFVNDQLPTASEPLPAGLSASERWQYSEREFGFGSDGSPVFIARGERRIGEIWSDFVALEDEFGEATLAGLWAAMTEVYPELQDWVARRGHGGAAAYRRAEMESEVARLRQSGADFVVVQVHGGFQFAPVKSEFVQRIAHAAIDAGADIVVAHHPHVIQGVELYRGKLVVYSLGNLVFDQDFLGTFPSAMLRVITEGSEILEARMIPLMLDRYRPVPVTGLTAARVVRSIDQSSALSAYSARVNGLEVETVLSESSTGVGGLVEPVSVRLERNSGLIVSERSEWDQTVETRGDIAVPLAACTIVRSDLLGETVELGVDLFGWGRFNDDTADGNGHLPLHWAVPAESGSWMRSAGRSLNPLDDSIELNTVVDATTSMRLLARIDIADHRLFDVDGQPLDAVPKLEVTMDVKRIRGEAPSLRFVTFDFEDSDPTVSPETSRLREIEVPIDVAADGLWHSVVVALPGDLFGVDADGKKANTATLIVDAPSAWHGRLAVDNVRVIEWRGSTSATSPTWVAADFVRSSDESARLAVSGC